MICNAHRRVSAERALSTSSSFGRRALRAYNETLGASDENHVEVALLKADVCWTFELRMNFHEFAVREWKVWKSSQIGRERLKPGGERQNCTGTRRT